MADKLCQKYLVGEEIGRGRYGVVHRCSSLLTGDTFAVKSTDKSQLSDEIESEGVRLEATMASVASVNNPGVVPVHAVYDDSESIHLVMELCDGPDLLEWLRIRPKNHVSEPEVAAIMAQLMQTLEACHKRGIAHRDIKPDNILFDQNGKIRLSDFGCAACFDMQNDTERGMKGLVGTPCYVAPEVLRGVEYNEKVDVWSAGVIMYVMLSGGNVPFSGDSPTDVFAAVLHGNLRFLFRMFEGVSCEAKDLMRKMICRDPSRRFTAEQALLHPWIATGGGVLQPPQ